MRVTGRIGADDHVGAQGGPEAGLDVVPVGGLVTESDDQAR